MYSKAAFIHVTTLKCSELFLYVLVVFFWCSCSLFFWFSLFNVHCMLLLLWCGVDDGDNPPNFVVVFPSSLFFVTFSTLFEQIPDPVQNIVLSLGWRLFGVTIFIVLARLSATKRIPGFCCSEVNSPGSTIKWLNLSFLLKPASEPWNLWMVVAQAVTRVQYITVKHACFLLQVLVIITMGMCCPICGYYPNFKYVRECKRDFSGSGIYQCWNLSSPLGCNSSHGEIFAGSFKFGKSTTI